jgi:hypothetical protein
MSEASNDEVRIRRFLLEDLDEEERERVEELFLTDSDTRDSVLLAEDELIEEYLEGSLQGADREKFRGVFVATPQLRRKVRIAQSLRSLTKADGSHLPAVAESSTQDRVTPLLSKPFKSWRRRNPLVYASIAAAILVVLTVGMFWYADYRREQARRLTIERELAELNDPSRRSELPSGQVLSVVLSPVSARSTGSSITPRATDAILELSLLPEIAKAETYAVLIQRVGSDDKFAVRNLRLEDLPAGKAIRVRIHTRLLNRGLYRLQLTGVTPDGRVVETNEYSFELFR